MNRLLRANKTLHGNKNISEQLMTSEELRILFVDDDEFVRKSFQRLLFTSCEQWQLEFAENGNEALAKLADGVFHVIVSDMRMPGMDGAELLTKVAEKYPDIIRIILSGQCEQETFDRAVEHAQSYLAKPCSLPALKEVIGLASM